MTHRVILWPISDNLFLLNSSSNQFGSLLCLDIEDSCQMYTVTGDTACTWIVLINVNHFLVQQNLKKVNVHVT